MADQVIEPPIEQAEVASDTTLPTEEATGNTSEYDVPAQEITYEVLVREDGSLMMRAEDFLAADLYPGQRLTISLHAKPLIVSRLAEEIQAIMEAEGVTLQDMLESLDQTREEIYQETYGQPSTHRS